MSKENVSYRMLKEYGFLVDAQEEAMIQIEKLPKAKLGETFGQWKKRVFGSADVEVVVYMPTTVDARTKIANLKIKSGGRIHCLNIPQVRKVQKQEESRGNRRGNVTGLSLDRDIPKRNAGNSD